MKKEWIVIICLLVFLGFTNLALAGVSLKVFPTLPASLVADGHSRIPIQVKVLDRTGKPLSEEGSVTVTVNRGGFSDPLILNNGLTLVKGVGKLEFIAPNKPGLVIIKFTYDEVSAELKLNFSAVAPSGATWVEQKAEVKSARGEVFWQDSGQVWKPARMGIFLGAGGSIRTGETGWVELKLADQTQMTLEPNTELVIKVLKVAKTNPNLKQSVFQITTGKILSKVSSYKTPGSKFEIGSDSATAGVRGTIFELTMEEEEIQVSVFDGAIDLVDLFRDRTIPVKSGELLEWWKNGEFNIEAEARTWADRERELAEEMAQAEAQLLEEIERAKQEILGNQGTDDTEEPDQTDDTDQAEETEETEETEEIEVDI